MRVRAPLDCFFHIRQNDECSCHHTSQHTIFLLGTCLELRPCRALVRRSIVLCLTALKCMSFSIHGSPRLLPLQSYSCFFFKHVVQALQNLVLLDECWNSNNCTAHMLLHPISRHPMSSRVTRPSPWKIFRICSQLHHLFSGITFPRMWFLRVPWSRFLYLCHDNVSVSHFQGRSTATVIQELDTKCFRRAKDTPRTQCNSTCSRGVWRRPCPNRTLRKFLFQVFDAQCLDRSVCF